MREKQFTLVSFKSEQGTYIAFVPLNQFLTSDKDMEVILRRITLIYQTSIVLMRKTLKDIENSKTIKKPVRLVWTLGDIIFRLTEDLRKDGFQIDGIYEHLTRDLGVKRKWLEKVIILRRYIPKQSMIPETLNWGKCEKGTRRIAENISKGEFPK